jgi:hypothetical protein
MTRGSQKFSLTACVIGLFAATFLSSTVFSITTPRFSGGNSLPRVGLSTSTIGSTVDAESQDRPSLCFLFASIISVAVAGSAVRRVTMRAMPFQSSEEGRRQFIVAAGLTSFVSAIPSAQAQISDSAVEASNAAPVDVPDRINSDPYELIGMSNPENEKEDYKVFYMKRNYKEDTYQVMKHMKISASLDKGTPNMEKWNKRVKEEMNDWLALYRRQDAIIGRQSYYSLYSGINKLASHFTSYGPKFPFPNKRRPRFFELMNTTEKYLEKGK